MKTLFSWIQPIVPGVTCLRFPSSKTQGKRLYQMAMDSGTGYKIRVGLMASQCYWSLLDESSL